MAVCLVFGTEEGHCLNGLWTGGVCVCHSDDGVTSLCTSCHQNMSRTYISPCFNKMCWIIHLYRVVTSQTTTELVGNRSMVTNLQMRTSP